VKYLEFQTELTKASAQTPLHRLNLPTRKADVSADDFDAVLTPVDISDVDMPDNATSIALIEAFVKSDKPVGVCHAPVALVNVRGKDGERSGKSA